MPYQGIRILKNKNAIGAPMPKPLFYLQDGRGLCGTNLMFWKKKGRGYGTNIDELEIYSLEQAQSMHNSRNSDVPLLKSLVDQLSIVAVDCQIIPESCNNDPNDEYVIQIKGVWNGNDILFLNHNENSYDYREASVFNKESLQPYLDHPDAYTCFSKADMDKISRRTFQVENFNKRKMCTTPGIKLVKPKRVRKTTGKTRGNCPGSGKITWSHDPHQYAYCSNECKAF